MTSRFDTVKQLQSVLATRDGGTETVESEQGPRPKLRRGASRRPALNNLFPGSSASQEAGGQPRPERLQDWVTLRHEEAREAGATPSSPLRSNPSVDLDALDAAVDRLFSQAGTVTVPGITGALPLLVFTPCVLASVSKPADALSRLSHRLEPYVQADYVAVVLSSPQPPNLPTSLLVSTYLSLSRPARKNIKRLYVVHPGFWSKMIVKLFLNGIVSGKVGRKKKVQTVDTLSALAKLVDIRNISLPLPVLQHNLKVESSISLPPDQQGKDTLFGVPLVEVMGADGRLGLPRVVKDCLHHLRNEGLNTEGVFRLSPPTSLLRIIKDAYDRGQPIQLATFQQDGPSSSVEASVHLAASLLKLYLRSLPQPLISLKDYHLVERAPAPSSQTDESIAYIREKLLPHWQSQIGGEAKLLLLASVLELLYETSLRSATNKMDSTNLALCLAPVMVRSHDLARDVRLCRAMPSPSERQTGPSRHTSSETATETTTLTALLTVMISRYHEVFDIDSGSFIDSFTHTQMPASSHTASATPNMSDSDSVAQAGVFSAPASPFRTPQSLSPRRHSTTPLPHSASDSPLSSPRRAVRRQRAFTAHSTATGSPSSLMSFGAADGRQSLKLMTGKKAGTTARMAKVTQSPVSVLGLFSEDAPVKPQDQPPA